MQEQLARRYEEVRAELQNKGTKVASCIADAALELWRLHAKPSVKKVKADNFKLLVQCPPDSLSDLITRLQKHPDFRHIQFAGFRPGVFPRIFNREVYETAMPMMFQFALETACERFQITPVNSATGEPEEPSPDFIMSLKHDFDLEDMFLNFGQNITLYGAFEFTAVPGFQKPEPRQPLVPPELIPQCKEVDRRPKRVKRQEAREIKPAS